MKSTSRLQTAAIVSAALALLLASCGDDAGGSGAGADVSGQVRVDGSSTVFPLSNAAAELFAEEAPDVSVTVGQSGTSGGFEAFCDGKTDISDASRPIDEEEVKICEENGIEFTELQVAVDALTVVAHPDVPVDCITTEQLKTIWEPAADGKITNWNQVDPSFPDLPLELFGPGTDSGTFDYFTDEINGEEGASRGDYESSEEDNVIVEGVAGTEGGMGYFGFTYFEENSDKLKALEVNSGSGCVAPSVETAQDGSYTPLARPLFIYPSNASYADKPQVKAFVDFYIENLEEIVTEAQYIPLNEEQYSETQGQLESALGG